MVTGAGLRLWPEQAALLCVNYTCKAYYSHRGHLLAREMRPAPMPAAQSIEPSFGRLDDSTLITFSCGA